MKLDASCVLKELCVRPCSVNYVEVKSLLCCYRQVAGGAARLLRGDRWKKNNSKLKLGVDHVSEDEDMYPKSGVRAFASPTVSRPVLKAGFAGPKLSRRLDYQLPVGFTERKFGYAAFTSHTSYWFNQDLASFFINQLLTDEQN